MGIQERKERNKLEMRKLILDTAMKLFLEEGFANVSIRRIADKIEYSPATIYLYFKDKDDILFALHNEGFEELYRRQQAILSIDDPVRRLQKHAETYIRFGLENPEYYNLMFIMRSPIRQIHDSADWSCGLRSYDLLKEHVRDCIGIVFDPDTDVDVATFALWSAAHGVLALILRHRCPMMDQQSVSDVALRSIHFLNNVIGINRYADSPDSKRHNHTNRS